MSLAAAPVLSGPTGSLLDLIGKTPMVEVTKIDTGPCRLFLKLEAQNPGGSIKDRIALSMIAAAEAEGFLKPGGDHRGGDGRQYGSGTDPRGAGQGL